MGFAISPATLPTPFSITLKPIEAIAPHGWVGGIVFNAGMEGHAESIRVCLVSLLKRFLKAKGTIGRYMCVSGTTFKGDGWTMG